MKKLALAALLCLANSSTSFAEQVGSYGGWTLYRDAEVEGPNCSIQGQFGEYDEFVHVFYTPKRNEVYFTFEERNATSIAEGDKRQLGIDFVKGSRLDDGWGEKEFVASVDKDNGVRSFATFLKAKEFLDDFAEATTIGITYKGKAFTAFNLSGTRIAVAKLKACAYAVSKLNPNDPFLED